jgi:hypothetical protein
MSLGHPLPLVQHKILIKVHCVGNLSYPLRPGLGKRIEIPWRKDTKTTSVVRKVGRCIFQPSYIASLRNLHHQHEMVLRSLQELHLLHLLQVKRSLKLGHVSTSTRPSATALPGSRVSGARRCEFLASIH